MRRYRLVAFSRVQAPALPADGACPLRRIGEFGTCYTASSSEVAFAESVIHESGRFVAGAYGAPAVELTERSLVRYRCERRKTLVPSAKRPARR